MMYSRCFELGSIWECSQLATECSSCKAVSLPASACTPITMGLRTSTLPLCPPLQNLTAQHEYTT
eukprot:1161209-Pelagomonas_calceolata.AAC.2